MTRAVIDLKPVKWKVQDGIGILNINEFSTDAGKDVRTAIRGIKTSLGHDPIGYIIDLRSDPGRQSQRSRDHRRHLPRFRADRLAARPLPL